MQTDRSPRFFCIPCSASVKCLRNQCCGNKALGQFLRDLQKNDLDGYRRKVRDTRLIEPDAPDGTPGLRSLADRRAVFAQLQEESSLHVIVNEKQGMLWPNREEYGALQYRNGKVKSAEEGEQLFDARVKEKTKYVSRVFGGVLRIAVPMIPKTEGTLQRQQKRSLNVQAGIHSGGALDAAKSRMNFGSLGVHIDSSMFADVAHGIFSSASSGAAGSAGAQMSFERPGGILQCFRDLCAEHLGFLTDARGNANDAGHCQRRRRKAVQ